MAALLMQHGARVPAALWRGALHAFDGMTDVMIGKGISALSGMRRSWIEMYAGAPNPLPARGRPGGSHGHLRSVSLVSPRAGHLPGSNPAEGAAARRRVTPQPLRGLHPDARLEAARDLVRQPKWIERVSATDPSQKVRALDPKHLLELAGAARLVVESAGRRRLGDVASALVGEPVAFWAALCLLQEEKVPTALIERRCLADWPLPGAPVIRQYLRVLKEGSSQRTGVVGVVARAIGLVREMGLEAFFAHAYFDGKTEKVRQAVMALRGADEMRSTIDMYLPAALQARQRIGLELEFLAGDVPPNGWDMVPVESRDEVVRRLAAEYGGIQGKYAVDMVRQDAPFQFADDMKYFPSMFMKFTSQEKSVAAQLLLGTGGMMLFTFNHASGAASGEPVDAVDMFSPQVSRIVAKRVADLLGVETGQVLDKMAVNDGFQRKYLTMLKDRQNEIVSVWMTFDAEGQVTLMPINGVFQDAHGLPLGEVRFGTQLTDAEVTALRKKLGKPDLTEVDAAAYKLRQQLVQGMLVIGRTDKLQGFDLMDLDTGRELGIRFVNEQWPYYELVTSGELTPDKFSMVLPAVEALRNAGYMGTTARTGLAMQTHIDTPQRFTTPEGEAPWTIRPLLSLFRAYLGAQERLHGILPASPVRGAFMRMIDGALKTWLSSSRFLGDSDAVYDPEDPIQILATCADIVLQTRPKYTVANADNWISDMLGKMVMNGAFQAAPGVPFTVAWRGQVYQFVTAVEGSATNRSGEVYLLQPDAEGNEVPIKLTRMQFDTRKPTLELRRPDMVHSHPQSDVYQIDPETVLFWMKFSAAFGWRNGRDLPMTEFQGARQARRPSRDGAQGDDAMAPPFTESRPESTNPDFQPVGV